MLLSPQLHPATTAVLIPTELIQQPFTSEEQSSTAYSIPNTPALSLETEEENDDNPAGSIASDKAPASSESDAKALSPKDIRTYKELLI